MKTKYLHSFRCLYATTVLVTGVAFTLPTASYALNNLATPAGGVVVGGSSTISSPGAGTLDITQTTGRSVINWGTFNIGKNATTQFFQPSASSLSVERVTGGNPAQILGKLKANGNVIILDPNGVLFGKHSVVDVNGIVASTGHVDTAQVMSGANTIQIKNLGSGTVENRGNITVADAGLAAFVAPTVRNSGTITANVGKVTLGSGDSATVDLCGDGLMSIVVNGSLSNALIENSGQITAHGGQITLTAGTASGIVNSAINNTGVLEASSMTAHGGTIILSGGNISAGGKLNANGDTVAGANIQQTLAGTGGTINLLSGTGFTHVTGTLNANGNYGGTIDITGDTINVPGKIHALGTNGIGGVVNIEASRNAGISGTIDTTGLEGGGTIFAEAGDTLKVSGTLIANPVVVDGQLHAPALPPGQVTLDASDVLFSGLIKANGFDGGGNVTLTGGEDISSGDIQASSTLQHNGGNILFSGAITNVVSGGKLTARGGPNSGNGGTITIESPDFVSPTAVIDVSAPAGTPGTFTH